jgi:hypothetical protein
MSDPGAGLVEVHPLGDEWPGGVWRTSVPLGESWPPTSVVAATSTRIIDPNKLYAMMARVYRGEVDPIVAAGELLRDGRTEVEHPRPGTAGRPRRGQNQARSASIDDTLGAG